MNDIRGFSPEEKVHKLVLETSLRHSVLGQYQKPSGEITDDELYEIFSRIGHRIYYTTDMPNFEMVILEKSSTGGSVKSKHMSVSTLQSPSIDNLVDIVLKECEHKYYIFYNIEAVDNNNTSAPGKYYRIRGAFYEDPAAIRDSKIKKILGEE
jgi:hypothetical protein